MGRLRSDTHFSHDDWRAKSPMFTGEPYRANLEVVAQLQHVADDLAITLPQLAIAWTLANPAVQIAIVGTRNQAHIDEVLAAADLTLDDASLRRIDEIAATSVPVQGPPVPGPSPEAVSATLAGTRLKGDEVMRVRPAIDGEGGPS